MTADPREFQSAPALITPGNVSDDDADTGAGEFQSAPALITPGNDGVTKTLAEWADVSIRPGAHHAGELPRHHGRHPDARSFNPPRRSSRRGTAVRAGGDAAST